VDLFGKTERANDLDHGEPESCLWDMSFFRFWLHCRNEKPVAKSRRFHCTGFRNRITFCGEISSHPFPGF
jgi:hypothetical protein